MDGYMTPRQLATELGLSVGTLANMRYRGTGPVFVKAGQIIRYKRADVQAWLDGNRHTRTDTRIGA
jgi:hypothetical protein